MECMLVCLEGAGVMRVGPEGLEMRRPESGFDSSGRMRVFASDSSSPAPQLGHEGLSSVISDVHVGHFMARRIVPFKIRGGPLESLGRADSRRTPGSPPTRFVDTLRRRVVNFRRDVQANVGGNVCATLKNSSWRSARLNSEADLNCA